MTATPSGRKALVILQGPGKQRLNGKLQQLLVPVGFFQGLCASCRPNGMGKCLAAGVFPPLFGLGDDGSAGDAARRALSLVGGFAGRILVGCFRGGVGPFVAPAEGRTEVGLISITSGASSGGSLAATAIVITRASPAVVAAAESLAAIFCITLVLLVLHFMVSLPLFA